MRLIQSFLALILIVVLLAAGCQTQTTTKNPTETPSPSTVPTASASVPLQPASFVLGDLTITPAAIIQGEDVTCSIPVSNIGGTEGSYTVVFKYKSSTGSSGSDNVVVTLQPGKTRAVEFTTARSESGTYFVSVNDKRSQYTVTQAAAPSPIPIRGVLATSASAITSPPPSMAGINTHTELYGTGADPGIITLGPKTGGHPGWPPYQYKCGMSFEAYTRGSPVLAPFDMVLVGFRDTGETYKIVSGEKITPVDDVKLFFESASPDWPGVYMTAYHLLTSPLLTGHTPNSIYDLISPAEGLQFFWDGNYSLPPTGKATSYGALIGYKVKRGELIGFAGSVGSHNFADFYFNVPDISINPNIKNGNKNLHLVQPGSFFYWKSYSPDAAFPSGVLAYPFECDGYQLPSEQHDINFKYTAKQ